MVVAQRMAGIGRQGFWTRRRSRAVIDSDGKSTKYCIILLCAAEAIVVTSKGSGVKAAEAEPRLAEPGIEEASPLPRCLTARGKVAFSSSSTSSHRAIV
jgi:hypothetical protein